MSRPYLEKFSPLTLAVKRGIRRERLRKGYNLEEGALLLGVSRKQLEDIETERSYGCHLDLELISKAIVVYGCSFAELVGQLPKDISSDFYVSPGKHKALK